MKTQMKFQKWLCFALLILGALAAVFALCYCSGLLAGIGTTTKNTDVDGVATFTTYSDYGYDFSAAVLYKDVQSFNDALFYLGIVLILLAVVLYITNTNKRRNYYASNYVASGVVCVANIGISIYCLIQNGYYYSRALNDILNNAEVMEVYQAIAAIDSNVELAYSESTVMFILGFILFAVIIVASLLLIFNLVWKTNLMKGEKALLKKSFAEEVA